MKERTQERLTNFLMSVAQFYLKFTYVTAHVYEEQERNRQLADIKLNQILTKVPNSIF
jgi:hypothetical protein